MSVDLGSADQDICEAIQLRQGLCLWTRSLSSWRKARHHGQIECHRPKKTRTTAEMKGTVEALITTFLANMRLRGLTRNTLWTSECILNRRARQEGSITPIGQITEEAVEAIVASLQSAQGRYANHLFHKPQQRIRSPNTVRKIGRPMRPFGSWLEQEGPRTGIIDELGLPLLVAAALAGNTRRSRKRQTER